MKKFFRIFVPILLALAVLLCLFWYLFVYDRAFTRDVLLYGARVSDKHNNHGIASWFYDLAYNQSVDSDDVAIELAEQHKASGNYTQAEVILSKAIEDDSSTALYTALCKTYVEQDKLLDAVKLLNGITDPVILGEMESLRPAAPTATPDPGFYNQYITVTVSGEGGTLYVDPTGQYPSVNSAPYSEPITLKDGENNIYAVSVADSGLVSPLSIFGYTVGGIIEEVTFADPAVEAAVREILDVGTDAVLMSNQLWNITAFTMPADAKTYADLEYMPFLRELTVSSGPSGEFGVLSNLTNLTTLRITDTAVSAEELEIIGTLAYLQDLTLSGCGLSTTAPLENLTSLTYLDLSNNTIRNIQALQNLTSLKKLFLQHNVLTDLSTLSGLINLTDLNISYNALGSLAPICNTTGLVWLDASHNSLTDLTGLEQLLNLQYLALSSNSITGIAPLASCTTLTELHIANNALTDISVVAELLKLVNLDFSYNQVTALPAFSSECSLVTINGSHNQLSSLDPLGVIHSLNNVYMDYNEDVESIEALASCYNLIVVNVYGTAVTEVKSLTDRSIIVNFNPTQ